MTAGLLLVVAVTGLLVAVDVGAGARSGRSGGVAEPPRPVHVVALGGALRLGDLHLRTHPDGAGRRVDAGPEKPPPTS